MGSCAHCAGRGGSDLPPPPAPFPSYSFRSYHQKQVLPVRVQLTTHSRRQFPHIEPHIAGSEVPATPAAKCTFFRDFALYAVQLLKNLLAFYGIRSFVIVFTRARHWFLSPARSIQFIPQCSISPRFILVLSTHLCQVVLVVFLDVRLH
jgi:hypothetical protein